jgi:hypothetical protein
VLAKEQKFFASFFQKRRPSFLSHRADTVARNLQRPRRKTDFP